MAPLHEAHGDIVSLSCRFSLTYLDDKRLYLYFYTDGGTQVVRAAWVLLRGRGFSVQIWFFPAQYLSGKAPAQSFQAKPLTSKTLTESKRVHGAKP